MATEVTDKDVEKSRDTVLKLAAEKLALEEEVAAAESNRNNAVIKAQLDTEGDRLKAEIAVLKEQKKVSTADPRKDPLIEQIRETVEPPAVDTDPVVVEPEKENK